MTFRIIIITIFFTAFNTYARGTEYLVKPTGQYNVGFEDLHWINDNVCPDPIYSRKNQDDFSNKNKKHCHEIMARIYYPTLDEKPYSLYYQPFIKSGLISAKQSDELKELKSFSIANAAIVPRHQFPVLLFSPGFGVQTQIYENIITHLVSHGYIVVGINTIFINGNIALPNGHIIKAVQPKSRYEANKKFLPIQIQDLVFVFNQIYLNHHKDRIFSSMNLKQVGAFGHSVGGRTVANVAQDHPEWFKAAATLDIAQYENKPISIYGFPFMNMISAYWESYFSWPIKFILGKDNYLVILTPSEADQHYSYHMNYSDFSTLQYLPAYQTDIAQDNLNRLKKIDVKFASSKLTITQASNIKIPTYLFVINKESTDLYHYEPGKKMNNIPIDSVAGLDPILSKKTNQAVETYSATDRQSIQNSIIAYQRGYGNFLGRGNGWEITKSINTYLLTFFDTYLKNNKNPAFKNCSMLNENSIIKCGPTLYK